MTLIEALKRVGIFLIAKKYAPLRTMLILVIIISSLAIFLTLNVAHLRAETKKQIVESKTLEIEDFGIDFKGKYSEGNRTGVYIVFAVKTNMPVQVMLLTDNVIAKELRTVNSDGYSQVTLINETFLGEEMYAQFLVSGTVTGEDGTQIKLEPLFVSPSTDTPKMTAPKVVVQD